MTLSELESARDAAGLRYSNAVSDLRAALIDLAALDAVLVNRNVNPHGGESRHFRKLPESLVDLEHQTFAPSLRDRLADQIAAVRDSYIAGATQ